MSKDLVVVILALAFAGASAALLVVLAKLQEEKERRWDEISRAASLENELDQMKLTATKYKVWFEECRNGNKALQDHLSALLCPMNDHVWKDGVCVKCGRVETE